MLHELKILPCSFCDVLSGRKRFEVRKNDRNFKVGDAFVLLEFDLDHGYTGRYYMDYIKYVLEDASVYGLKDGYVIFSW